MRFTQFCVVLGVLAAPALASAQIKEPGAHKRYSVELEPHLLVQWNESCASDGFGPGFRATIPFLDNGPIPKINNNMGIGFGLDWAHSGINSRCPAYYRNGVYYGDGYTADIWQVPVVVQWNFFLLPKVSVFGEAGIVFQHRRYDGAFNCANGNVCYGPGSENGWDASFAAGGRFLISDSVGFLLRIGYPYLSAGVSILL
ncbi:MAG TPA: hypothetical protein VER11_28445 [Polyangiaceae bacterium]|nr:hypothetical protein [Polyangiaceae bacterium]